MDTVQLPLDEQIDLILKDIEEYRADSDPRKRDDITLLILEIGKPLSLSSKIKDALKFYKDKDYPRAIDILSGLGEAALGGLHLYLLSKMHLATGDRDKALAYAESALVREPGRIDFIYQKGKVLFAAGDREGARENFELVSEQDSGYKKVADYLVRLET